jgi:SAM-dependent methyltransferase
MLVALNFGGTKMPLLRGTLVFIDGLIRRTLAFINSLIKRILGNSLLGYKFNRLTYRLAVYRMKLIGKLINLFGNKQDRFDSSLANGLPIPPRHLRFLVGGNTDINLHLLGGKYVTIKIRDTLIKNGVNVEGFRKILDFGCGCGRIIRYWNDLKETRMYGTDYNTESIQWCRENLRFADFATNKLAPPTSYREESFDFIYVYSVFTHLSESLQLAWMKELWRILQPGGYLLITTHGENHIAHLPQQEQDLFRSGNLIVDTDLGSGSNLCTTYHPEKYVEEILAKDFEVIDFTADAAGQDFYLLRRTNTI